MDTFIVKRLAYMRVTAAFLKRHYHLEGTVCRVDDIRNTTTGFPATASRKHNYPKECCYLLTWDSIKNKLRSKRNLKIKTVTKKVIGILLWMFFVTLKRLFYYQTPGHFF